MIGVKIVIKVVIIQLHLLNAFKKLTEKKRDKGIKIINTSSKFMLYF